MDPFINLLQKGLDGAAIRQQTLANNIANVDTPDYKRRDVDFLSTLKKEAHSLEQESILPLRVTDDKHLATSHSSKPFKKLHMTNTSNRQDDNNVDVEYEMAELAKNSIYYNTLIQQINERFKLTRDVIEKGGR